MAAHIGLRQKGPRRRCSGRKVMPCGCAGFPTPLFQLFSSRFPPSRSLGTFKKS